MSPMEKMQRPLNTAFLLTSMPVGGAETLLVNLVRRLDRGRFTPEIICLKELGELGEVMAREVTTTSRFLRSKFDLRVLPRLIRYFRQRKMDAIVTVGAGDKMFWGRLAGCLAKTPVVMSALHSTGWPDGLGRLNRTLTPLTDAFIGVAEEHGRFLREHEKLPNDKVFVIPNGVDTARFDKDESLGKATRQDLQIPADAPVCGILAALRPEKNHALFLRVANHVHQQLPDSHFLIVGDGPQRAALESHSAELGLTGRVHFLGCRDDIPALLNAIDVLMLTSHNEANPVSILEGLACEVPVVATHVGSVATTVIDNQTGFLAAPDDDQQLARHAISVLTDRALAQRLGQSGRRLVQEHWSVDRMVVGYEDLLTQLYLRKRASKSSALTTPQPEAVS